MATYYYDSAAAGGGDGSLSTPYNDFTTIPSGVGNVYLLAKGSTFTQTFTIPSNSCEVGNYGSGDLPIIDCTALSSGVYTNSRTGCTIWGVRVINQNAAAPQGAFRVNGSGHTIYGCETEACQNSVHCNNSADNTIRDNTFDIGNAGTTGLAYGVRLNGTSDNNTIIRNTITSTAVGMTYMAGIQAFGGPTGGTIAYNVIEDCVCDGILLKAGASGFDIVANIVRGTGLLDAIGLEGASGCTVEFNTVIHSADVAGHEGPAMKLGNDFGAGSGSDQNTIRYNIFVMNNSTAPNRVVVMNPVGQRNLFTGNRYYKPDNENDDPFVVDTNGTDVVCTFTKWKQLSGDATGTWGDPGLTSSEYPDVGSPVIFAGGDSSSWLDNSGRTRPAVASIGALEPLVALEDGPHPVMQSRSGALWVYASDDAHTTVASTDFFQDGYARGMRAGDAVIVVQNGVGATIHAVSAADADGTTVASAILA